MSLRLKTRWLQEFQREKKERRKREEEEEEEEREREDGSEWYYRYRMVWCIIGSSANSST